MNVNKLIVAAGFALATTGAFAETGGVNTADIGHVSNVYGRASVAAVKVQGPIASQAADVADAGRDTAKGDTKIAVSAGGREVGEAGRS